MARNKPRIFLFSLLVFILISSSLTGCSGNTASNEHQGLAMADMAGMPDEVKDAPITVQQAYQFAVANPETIKEFPCYCGCGKMGHTSNYSCYVQDVDSSGNITYDTHALGCSICVDITLDVMRLIKEDKPISEIKTYIDDTYSKYGPSNLPGASVPGGANDQSVSDSTTAPACGPGGGCDQ